MTLYKRKYIRLGAAINAAERLAAGTVMRMVSDEEFRDAPGPYILEVKTCGTGQCVSVKDKSGRILLKDTSLDDLVG
jgi:hypothetical protein